MSENVHSTRNHHPFHPSSANRHPSVYPYPFLYPFLDHRLFLSNHPIRFFLAHLVVENHNHVHTDPFHTRVHQTDQIDHGSRKGLQELRGKEADEIVVAQVDGTGIVDVGVAAGAKVLAQAVDVDQRSVDTVSMLREVQEAEAHSPKAVDHVHWMAEE
jgi:hypothetical protein